jgi:hypothetical protein
LHERFRYKTSDDLKRIQDQYIIAAKFARDSGFDAVDLKACHGYLIAIAEDLEWAKMINQIFQSHCSLSNLHIHFTKSMG